jgi:Predicted glycosyltransferases
MNPAVSIVIVNYNGKDYIDKCILSILSSIETYSDFELIIVDNGSNDGTVAFIRSKYEIFLYMIKFVELNQNYGPARARNEGVKIASGKYIGFLDNDTIVDKNWILAGVRKFESNNKIGVIQCKLLLMDEPNKIDSIGEWIGRNGFLIQIAPVGSPDNEEYNKEYKILSAKSAGMFIRKDVFDTIGGFDDDYFIYMEETDLCWRVLLIGYENIFLPDSIVFHKFGTSSVILGKDKINYALKFHGTKNYILTLLKNLNSLNLVFIVPIHILLWIGLAYFGLIYKRKLAFFIYIHKGILWNVVNILKTFQKRKSIQKVRIISDKDIFYALMKKRSFFYYVNKVLSNNNIGNSKSYFE